MINTLKNIYRKNKYRNLLNRGLEAFNKSGITSPEAYNALRQMFILTKGASNDEITGQIIKKQGKYQDLENGRGILGDILPSELQKMVEIMNKQGYYIFEQKLSQEVVDDIYNYALSTPASFLDIESNRYSSEEIIFDEKNPVSPRYQFSPQVSTECESIQKLIFDQSLLLFAQEYLGCKPILDLIAFWWSVPFKGKGLSEAAQMYHFDMDRIKFIKFFFYLTDVDTETGPHCYVAGSHRNLPAVLARDGRFTDNEIESVYGSDRLIEICGQKGTIMAVDTRGFHKGKELLRDKRLLFQIEFAVSMFGQTYPPMPVTYFNEEYATTASKYAYSYKQIFK